MSNAGIDNAPRNPTLTGEALARMALADFENFFLPGRGMHIPLTIGDTRSHASAKSRGTERWIAISRDMASQEIDGPTTLFFHLLILGHEIAHIVHEHTYAGEQQADEHSALEFWADFYGAKVMMTLVTFGDQISGVMRSYFPVAVTFDKPLAHVAEAADRMVEGNVYNRHARYPAPMVRVGLISNGVTSFLRHNMADSFSPGMYLQILLQIISGGNVQRLIDLEQLKVDFATDPTDQILEWHRKIQGDRRAITPDFRLNLLPYLHTTFDQTDEERAESKRVRLAEMHSAGYLLDVTEDNL